MPLVLLRNHYRPINFLDKGGFGRTFLAENIHKFDELCVIKQLAPQAQETWARKKARELFEQEAKKLQKLGEHSQIPSLTAYFEQDNYWYIVQQFIEGKTLYQEFERQGVFTEDKIWKLLSELLVILKFIHQDNVIHRDIKPANIMRRHSDRQLVLIDFGIAKELAETTFQKRSNNSMGTEIGSRGYASPEQMQGGRVSPASDLYSLGATCFHLLSGISPHTLWLEHGYSWTVNWQKYIQIPISQPLVSVLNKLLQKDFQDRYQNVNEVLVDLKLKISDSKILSLLPNSSQTNAEVKDNSIDFPSQKKIPVTVVRSLSSQTKKKIHSWLLFSILIFLGFAGILHQLLQNKSLQTESNITSKTLEIEPLKVEPLEVKPLKVQPLKSPSEPQSKQQSISQESQKINYLKPKSAQTINVGIGVNSVAISSDGKTLVSSGASKTIKIWDVKSGRLQSTLTGHQNIITSVAISGDGKILASGSSDRTINIWDLKSGRLQSTLTGHKRIVDSVAISGDGKTLVSGSSDNTIKIWNVKTGKLQSTLTGHKNNVTSVAISGDGKTLASGSSDRTIKIWDLKTEALQFTLTGHNDNVHCVAISGDGNTLVSGSWDNIIKVWDLKTRKLKFTLTGHQDNIDSVAISSDGKTLVSGSNDETIKIWDVKTGKLLSTLTESRNNVTSVAISSDGKTLVSDGMSKTIKIWKFE
jgi:WD40 repeat protein/tRNA A-37 threonylcarbamoyl transferase component Bud32